MASLPGCAQKDAGDLARFHERVALPEKPVPELPKRTEPLKVGRRLTNDPRPGEPKVISGRTRTEKYPPAQLPAAGGLNQLANRRCAADNTKAEALENEITTTQADAINDDGKSVGEASNQFQSNRTPPHRTSMVSPISSGTSVPLSSTLASIVALSPFRVMIICLGSSWPT